MMKGKEIASISMTIKLFRPCGNTVSTKLATQVLDAAIIISREPPEKVFEKPR
jgi:hypothetical protein